LKQVRVFPIEDDQPGDKNRKDEDERKEPDHKDPLPSWDVRKIIFFFTLSPGTPSAATAFFGFFRVW